MTQVPFSSRIPAELDTCLELDSQQQGNRGKSSIVREILEAYYEGRGMYAKRKKTSLRVSSAQPEVSQQGDGQ